MRTVFVERKDGKIVGWTRYPFVNNAEELPEDHPDLVALDNPAPKAPVQTDGERFRSELDAIKGRLDALEAKS